jgi:hypothetical protein
MTVAQREVFRGNILTVLDANPGDRGLPTEAILSYLKARFGFNRETQDQVDLELEYLQNLGLVEPVKKIISPELRLWRITLNGRNLLNE